MRNIYNNIADFTWHKVANEYLNSEANIRGIVKGNQGGGTAVSTLDAIHRLLGIHPVKRRNKLNKPIRFISKCLPKNDEDEENQQYVEFKRRFPSDLIKKDVTARSTIMIVRDPKGGADRKVEFMSSKQDIDAFMSVQRSAVYQDEEIERLKWDENQMRLLREGGDTTIVLTPVRGLDWTYDDIWRKAKRIYRSKTICKKYGYPEIVDKNTGTDIEIFCWATDDNPIMNKSTIDGIFRSHDDPDELAMRRYGVFRQVSGRIYKSFDTKIHVIKFEETYNPERFRRFWHYRVIDYHPSKPWYVSWVAISPTNEWYVWQEKIASHDRCTDLDIRDQIKAESLLDEDEEFNRCTLIDPLAQVKQQNTGYSVFDDITMGYEGLRRVTSADTKNKSGRMNIMLRLKNSIIAKVPGNNTNKNTSMADIRFGNRLPTIWFMDTCKTHIEHFNSWRHIDWKQEAVKAVRTTKRESEKWNDFPRNLEFLGALNPVFYTPTKSNYEPSGLFQGRRARG